MIDWKRPRAKICGASPIPGARYEQDGKFFRVDGSEINDEPSKEPAALEQPETVPDFVYTPPAEEPTLPGGHLKQQMQELSDQGYRNTEIGEMLGVTRQKVTKVLCS